MRNPFPTALIRFFKTVIPWFFFSSVWKKFHHDNALFLARGLAFDVLVCLVPVFFLLFVLFGFLFDSSRETTQYLSPYLKSMIPFSQQQVTRNLFAVVKNQKVLGILGGIGMVWTLSRLFGSIRTVLGAVVEVKAGR
jgi:YihY family inner membrane protein